MKLQFLAKIALTICAIATFFCSHAQENSRRDSIEAGIKRIMTAYPKATLQDIYKSFFQDNYGPGHLMGDTAAATAYVRRELGSFDLASGPDYEATGSESNFVRVNLQVVKDGRVPLDTFLDAFLRSARQFQVPPIEQWSKKWEEISGVVKEMDLKLPGQAEDSEIIRKQLSDGDPTMHHSLIYETAYKPHYRIILRSIFESEILPFLLP